MLSSCALLSGNAPRRCAVRVASNGPVRPGAPSPPIVRVLPESVGPTELNFLPPVSSTLDVRLVDGNRLVPVSDPDASGPWRVVYLVPSIVWAAVWPPSTLDGEKNRPSGDRTADLRTGVPVTLDRDGHALPQAVADLLHAMEAIPGFRHALATHVVSEGASAGRRAVAAMTHRLSDQIAMVAQGEASLRAALMPDGPPGDVDGLNRRFARFLGQIGGVEAERSWGDRVAAQSGADRWRSWVDLTQSPVGSPALLALAQVVWRRGFQGDIQLGPSDFLELRRAGALYVDKTDFVRGVLEDAAQVQLITRPRRFGKTLNLSTLRHYLSRSEEDLRQLLSGDLERRIAEDFTYRDLHAATDGDVLSLLLFSGYLTGTGPDSDGQVRLQIPNREVRQAFERLYRRHFETLLGGADNVRTLTTALLAGDAESAEAVLSALVERVPSTFDLPRGQEQPFHNFVLGLMASLESSHEVRSNRESGYGRYDVMLTPKDPGGVGILLEFKVAPEKAALEAALDAAERQIRDRDDTAELRDRGVGQVHAFAVAASGKFLRCRRLG